MSTMPPVPPSPQHAPARPSAEKKAASDKKPASNDSKSDNNTDASSTGNNAALNFLALLSMADAAMPQDDDAPILVGQEDTQLLTPADVAAQNPSLDQSAWAAMAAAGGARTADGMRQEASARGDAASSTLSLGKDRDADPLGLVAGKAGAAKSKKTNEALLAGAVAVATLADAQQRKEEAMLGLERKQAFMLPVQQDAVTTMQMTQTVVTETVRPHVGPEQEKSWTAKQENTPVGIGADALSTGAQTNGIMGADGVVATGAVLEMDHYQQEDVVFWGAGDVQNADVTVTGLDGAPLGITVSMQGNEAQVAFRTDVPEVRQALEASNQQLRDTLNAQGMGLAAMSVGQFSQPGTGGDGANQGRSKPAEGGRKVQVGAVSPDMGLSSRGVNSAGRPAGRSGALDLYV